MVQEMIKDKFEAERAARDKASFDAALLSASQAAKDQACIALGLAAGCQ